MDLKLVDRKYAWNMDNHDPWFVSTARSMFARNAKMKVTLIKLMTFAKKQMWWMKLNFEWSCLWKFMSKCSANVISFKTCMSWTTDMRRCKQNKDYLNQLLTIRLINGKSSSINYKNKWKLTLTKLFRILKCNFRKKRKRFLTSKKKDWNIKIRSIRLLRSTKVNHKKILTILHMKYSTQICSMKIQLKIW